MRQAPLRPLDKKGLPAESANGAQRAMWIFVLSVSLALGFSFLCSLMEACLLSLSTSDIAAISERYPAAAATWKRFKENIQKPIAVILIVNTLSHTMGATIAGASFTEAFRNPKWIGMFTLVFSLVMIQYTELLPKTLGVRFNRTLAILTAAPMSVLVRVFHPIVFVCDFINRPFSRSMQKGAAGSALDEIRLLAGFARVNRLITREQESLLERTIKLSAKKVRDIIVERDEMKTISTDMSLADALIAAHVHHHTRYPLVENGNLDRIVGFVNMKDIVSALKMNPTDPGVRAIARPISFINPDLGVASLLRELIKGFQHIAVVQNAAGRTLGMVTMEDLLEEVVGDIEDEYDVVPSHFFPICPDRYLVGGGALVRDIAETTGADLPETSLNLNDWFQAQLDEHPKTDAYVQEGGFRFTVRKMRRSKIYEAIVEKADSIAGEHCAEPGA